MPALRKILCVTDFSPAAQQALPYAVRLARAFGGEVHLVHVLVLGADDPVSAQKALDGLVPDELADTVTERRMVKAVHADVGIVHEADAGHYDAVVLGTHGHSALAHVLLGSVAERVVQHATCPVLTVRVPDFVYTRP
ncbi:MAG: universal stress protein [Planctomycetota bacterium]|nr:MAG: universal stress protein [Planctomycetota bacterium]